MHKMPCRVASGNSVLVLFTKISLQFVSPLERGMQLWNVTLPTVPVVQKPSRTAIVDTIQTTLQLDQQEANAFFERMVARKAYLFPEEIQPAGSMTMFMRKEVEYLITPFAESQLHLSADRIPPDRDDATVLEALRQLEARIAAGEDYGDWEADFFAIQRIFPQTPSPRIQLSS